jgi:hypothetical protein
MHQVSTCIRAHLKLISLSRYYHFTSKISNIRQKHKNLDKEGSECEPDIPGSAPKIKRGRSSQIGAVTLTKERIDQFNAINFSWDLTGPPRQSWDTRFEQMMEYYRVNGRWPPHAEGTLGEWVHKVSFYFALEYIQLIYYC